MAKNDKPVEIRVHAELLQSAGAERPRIAAYAYSKGGKLLDHKPLDDKGATLTVPIGSDPTAVRVLVGPAIEDPAVDDLARRGAEEQHLRLDPKELRASVRFDIAPRTWKYWILGACVVKG